MLQYALLARRDILLHPRVRPRAPHAETVSTRQMAELVPVLIAQLEHHHQQPVRRSAQIAPVVVTLLQDQVSALTANRVRIAHLHVATAVFAHRSVAMFHPRKQQILVTAPEERTPTRPAAPYAKIVTPEPTAPLDHQHAYLVGAEPTPDQVQTYAQNAQQEHSHQPDQALANPVRSENLVVMARCLAQNARLDRILMY